MSYKALLFCPDQKTALLVTQVLSELDFSVERAGETFATVKKLSDQHFDALVVDIENEQDASLIFKGARTSAFNHSSLYVAVVEAQAGVAKAFRIGANLVLTKPINIEQSKSTLRVARGLLKKNEGKTQAAAAPAQLKSASSIHAIPASSSIPAMATPAPPAMSAIPFASLERETDPVPAAEPSEVAVLESMRDPNDAKSIPSDSNWAPRSSAEPIAASTGHSGAAAAPAKEKTTLELKSSAPLATHEAITADAPQTDAISETAAGPTFGSYTDAPKEKSGGGLLTIVGGLIVLGGAAYWASQQPRFAEYFPGSQKQQYAAPAEPAKPVVSPASVPSPEPQSFAPATSTTNSTGAADHNAPPTPVATPFRLVPDHYTAPEVIQAEEPSEGPKITVTPRLQPIIVKPGSSSASAQKPVQVAPPSVEIATSNSPSALADIVTSSSTVVPRPAPGSVHISQGVSQGLLIKKVAPVYPASALQLRKHGTVELLATINKDGAISAIKVLSGEASLAQAALTAVRQWKYRPYLLNGEPVAIETQITVNFKLPQ